MDAIIQDRREDKTPILFWEKQKKTKAFPGSDMDWYVAITLLVHVPYLVEETTLANVLSMAPADSDRCESDRSVPVTK